MNKITHNTAPDLVRVTNEVIAERGHEPVNYRKARNAVGYGSRRMIMDALEAVGDEACRWEQNFQSARINQDGWRDRF